MHFQQLLLDAGIMGGRGMAWRGKIAMAESDNGQVINENGQVVNERGTDWRSLMMRWLFQQGVSTVLLFMIFIYIGKVLYDGVPAVIASQQKIHETNSAAYNKLAETLRADQDRIMLQHQALLTAVADLRAAALELRSAARQQTTMIEKVADKADRAASGNPQQ